MTKNINIQKNNNNIIETFEYLTLSALVDDKIFCVHGGIPEEIKELDDVI